MIPLHDDNPTRLFPVVTVILITACCLVFFWELSLGARAQQAFFSFGAIPSVVLGDKHLPQGLALVPAWLTVISSMFLHGGWMHLIGNMLYLWIFGNNIEDAMGHGRFIVFYLLCGMMAFLAHALLDSGSDIPTVGASGAISGVLGAYLLLYPHARVLVAIPLGFIIHTTRIPAAAVLILWFVFQVVSSLLSNSEQSGVAWLAHVGGFVAGCVLIPLFKRADVRFWQARR